LAWAWSKRPAILLLALHGCCIGLLWRLASHRRHAGDARTQLTSAGHHITGAVQ
jgi:hypothetical protein